MNVPESFEGRIERKRQKRIAQPEVGKLSARVLAIIVFLLTGVYWIWAFTGPNPPAVSLLAEFWDGVALFCPWICLLLSIILLFSYMRSDPTCEIWAYMAAFMTTSIWFLFLLRPHPSLVHGPVP